MKCCSVANPARLTVAEFAVNGTGIPEVPFDIGESYAGLLPISDDPDESRQLFFWYAIGLAVYEIH